MLKKGQSTIEFSILLAGVFFFFISFLVLVYSNISDKSKEGIVLEMREIGMAVQDEINLASDSGNGYERVFELPYDVEGIDYFINITSGLVYIRTVNEKYALSLSVLNVSGDVRKGQNVIKKINGSVYLN